MRLNFPTQFPRPKGHHRILTGTINVSIAAMVMASLAIAGIGLFAATSESDAASVERQARTAMHSMEASVDELALQQETVAIWDDAAKHLLAHRPDKTWVHENIGGWLHKIFAHDEVFILNGWDRPVYASAQGKIVPLKRYKSIAGELETITSNARFPSPGHRGIHDRQSGQVLNPRNTVRTTGRPTHDSHIILVGGRPAAVSAMLMQPSTPNYVRPVARWPILISIRYLDRGFLQELSARQLIASPHFSRKSVVRRAEHAVALKAETGTTLGYLIWRPELPGTRIMWNLVPLNLLILLFLTIFMVFLGRRLSKAANELSAAEANSAHLAFNDSLTGLPNRACFQQNLDERISEASLETGFALILLDVDEFKVINDTLGHDAGDAVLIAFADRLNRSLRPGDLVARLGGDEFALILSHRPRDELETYSQTLLSVLREPIEHRGQKIQGRASIGASISGGSSPARDMLKHADLALYEAKASGGGLARVYDPIMWASMQMRQEMLRTAEAALEGNFIFPYYQAKVNLQTGEIVGFEALLRCCIPGQPAKGPECLMAALEDADLAVALSDRIIDRVIADVIAWRAEGIAFGHVAINAAAVDIRRGDFASRLLTKLDTAGVPTECIQVEITESVLLGQGLDHVERTFRDLARRGIQLALDDFGTGFASLTHLKKFPIQIIKIDQSFVRELQVDTDDGAIVDALIGLGKALKIQVVAEGIETTSQRDFLSALDCAIGQGFLFGHALPAADIADLLLSSFQRKLCAAA